MHIREQGNGHWSQEQHDLHTVHLVVQLLNDKEDG